MKRVQPFSNGAEFTQWHENNCDLCCRYENRSAKVENAKCRHAFYLDLASATDGMIPINSALKIGCKAYNGMDESCMLNDKCNFFDKPLKVYPRRKIDKRQKEIFV